MKTTNRDWIIHFDMDAFFASVEMRDKPELKDKPMAIGVAADRRGVLCTANYPARKFGVRSAMSTAHALKLCPHLILIPPKLGYYSGISKQIFQIISQYTECLEGVGLDEGYFILEEENPLDTIKEIQDIISQEMNLTASFGIARTKFLAKIASDWNKPNGIKMILPHEEDAFIAALPLRAIPGIGPKTLKKLEPFGMKTCAEARLRPLWWWQSLFGKWGSDFWNFIHGRDDRKVSQHTTERKQISVERTFSRDINLQMEAPVQLLSLVDDLLRRVKRRMSTTGATATPKGVEVKITFNNFNKVSKRKMVDFNGDSSHFYDQLLEAGHFLLGELAREHVLPVRLVGIGLYFPEEKASDQLCLFPNAG